MPYHCLKIIIGKRETDSLHKIRQIRQNNQLKTNTQRSIVNLAVTFLLSFSKSKCNELKQKHFYSTFEWCILHVKKKQYHIIYSGSQLWGQPGHSKIKYIKQNKHENKLKQLKIYIYNVSGNNGIC